MVHKIRILGLAVSALLLPAVRCRAGAAATEIAGRAQEEQLDPDACAHRTRDHRGEGRRAPTRERQDGKGNLSDKLARSGGVICPPDHVDSEMNSRPRRAARCRSSRRRAARAATRIVQPK